MNVKLTVSVFVLGLAGTALAQQTATPRAFSGPSFDCSKARGRIEKSICADAQVAALDQKAAELFAQALVQSQERGDVQRDQRRWLRERDDCEDLACLKSRYESRLQALATYTGRLPESSVRALCARLASPDSRAETLENKAGSDDINNDDIPEIATQCAGGTANVPCIAYLDRDRKPVLIKPQRFDWSTYSPLGRVPFRFENRTFVYYSRDAALAEPSLVSYVTPTNRELPICELETSVGSAVLEGGHDVCAAIESGEGIEPIELAAAPDTQSVAFGRESTFAKRVGTVDVDNDGLDDDIIELSYESGGGRGCTFNYFELLAADRSSLLGNSKTQPLRELQGVPDGGYRGRNCGNIENRWFKFNDKIYYEMNVANARLAPHEVRVLEGTAVGTLCTFERQVTTRVTKVFAQ